MGVPLEVISGGRSRNEARAELDGSDGGQVDKNGKMWTFHDLCFRPVDFAENADNPNLDCVIQSVAGYWQNNRTHLWDDYCGNGLLTPDGKCRADDEDEPPYIREARVVDHFTNCTSNPTYTGVTLNEDGCLPPFQDPIRPEVVLGGYVRERVARKEQ